MSFFEQLLRWRGHLRFHRACPVQGSDARRPRAFGPKAQPTPSLSLSLKAPSALTVRLVSGALSLALPNVAEAQGLRITEAWVLAAEKVGVDVPLFMTVHNETQTSDSLMRVRCPVANFSERHTIDRGEGAPAMRSISSIPLAVGITVLKPDSYHVMLLQTRQPLAEGEQFKCVVVLQKAGSIDVEVSVRKHP